MDDKQFRTTFDMNFQGENVTRRSMFNMICSTLLEYMQQGTWGAAWSAGDGDVAFFPVEYMQEAGFPVEDAWTVDMVNAFWMKKGPCIGCKWQAMHENMVAGTYDTSCALLASPFYKRWLDAEETLAELGCNLFEAVPAEQLAAGYLLYDWDNEAGYFTQKGAAKQSLRQFMQSKKQE